MNLHVVIGEISDWLMLVERYVIAHDDIMGNYLCPSEGIIASCGAGNFMRRLQAAHWVTQPRA
jgi:hypothetical protein